MGFENDGLRKKGNTSVFGIFQDRGDLERSVEKLKAHGFRNSDISILVPQMSSNEDLVMEKTTKAPEGATVGGVSGLAIGGVLGWLVGIGLIAIPGVGPFLAAGPLITAIAGAGVGSSLGGIAGAFIGMGFPEYEAKRYESSVKLGGMLLSIHVDDNAWKNKAVQILKSCGAKDISSTQEKFLTPPKEKAAENRFFQMI